MKIEEMLKILKNTQRYKIFTALFFLLFITSFFTPVSANDDDEDEWEEKPLWKIVDNDTAKDFGYIAIFFLIIGGLYILVKRAHFLSKSLFSSEKYSKVTDFTTVVYSKTRLPLFYAHLGVNLLATVVAFVHGLSVELEGGMVVLSGMISGIFMLLLSVSGVIIWKKFWPGKESRKLIRAAHRQWLYTAIVVITLVAHLAFLDD